MKLAGSPGAISTSAKITIEAKARLSTNVKRRLKK
jgi:hypothetical protein